MFKIGEFSRLVRVSARMLRHYEKCGLFYPAETDKFTGYRLYSAGQIPLLSKIVALRDMGFSIDEIGDILPRFDEASFMERVLPEKQREIEGSIAIGQEKLAKLAAMLDGLRKENVIMTYNVELKELPEVKVLSLREVIPAYDREGDLWHKLGKFMAENGIACDAGGYSIYPDEEYKESDVEVEIAVPVKQLGENRGEFVYKTLDAIPLAATVRFAGPYDGYSAAIEKLAQWIEQNDYEFAGSVRGLAIVTPREQSDPKNFLTELQVPVRKRSGK